MKLALVGHKGSIGSRRKMLLEEMGHTVTGFEINDRFDVGEARKFEAVFVCSPNQEHYSHVLTCINAKVPFFCEKPMCPDIRDAHNIGNMLMDSELVHMIACNIRFTEEFKFIKAALPNIGTPLYTVAEFGYYLPYWRKGDYRNYYSAYAVNGGGILLDAIHEFDYLVDLFGDLTKPKTFMAFKVQNTGELEIETEDNATIFTMQPNGNCIFLHLDYLQRTYSRKFTCVGTKSKVEVTFNTQDNNAMYRGEMKHFLDCVKSKEETCNTVFQHLKILDTVDLIKARSETPPNEEN